METKFQYTVLVYTQGREIPDELTIEVAENNLRLNKCLKDKIANYIKPGHFIYSARNTITIDGEEISTNKVIEDEGTIPTTNFIARLRLEPKEAPTVPKKRSYNRSQSNRPSSPFSQNQGSSLDNPRSQDSLSSILDDIPPSHMRVKKIKQDGSNSVESVKSKQSFSNANGDSFSKIMQQHGYCIIGHNTLSSVSQIFPYDKKLKQQGAFNYLEQNESITMHFPYLEDKFLPETKATKHIVDYLKRVFENELKYFGYDIIDVKSGDKFILSIPYSSDHNTNDVIKGRTDIVIAPKEQSQQKHVNNICVGIEIKNPITIHCQQSFRQFILEFIGALTSLSNIPMLFVSTDLKTFKFLWLSDPDKKIIRLFQTQDVQYSINLMKQFIAYHHHHHRSISIDYKSSVNTPNIKPNKDEIVSRKKKVEAVYYSLLAEDKLKKLVTNSRTGAVFKIEIDEKPYVLKMASLFDKATIYYELQIEHKIYDYLSNLRKEIGDCFPQLYYAGNFLELDFAIVTSYIEGRCPAKNWINAGDRMLCREVLGKINSTGVLHGDARSANFIIVEKQPYKDENGQIEAYEKTAYILDFGFSRKFYFPQVEDLKPDP